MTHWQLVKQKEDNIKQDTPIHSPSKSQLSLESDEKLPQVPPSNLSKQQIIAEQYEPPVLKGKEEEKEETKSKNWDYVEDKVNMDSEIAKIDAELKNLKLPKSKWNQEKGENKVK